MNKKVTHIKHSTKNRGFTLIELLFAMALLGFMLTITMVTFLGVFRFYIWAQTTRTNQSSARLLIDTISRDVQASNVSSATTSIVLCLNTPTNPSGTKSQSYGLNGRQMVETTYNNLDCALPSISTQIISNQALTISNLNFGVVKGAINNPCSARVCNPPTRKTVTFSLTITNGHPTGNPSACAPGDNFCNQAQFDSAANEATPNP